MIKFKFVLQEALKICMIFLFVFVWIRFFVRKFYLSLLISSLITVVCELFLLFITKKISKSSTLKIKEKEDAENMFFSLSNSDSQGLFLRKLFQKYSTVEKVCSHYIICKKDSQKYLVYFADNYDGLGCEKLFEIIKKFKKENIQKTIILCRQIKEKDVYAFVNSFDGKVIVLDEYQTYQKLYKKHQIFPEITNKLPTEKKMSFKLLVAYSFNKKRTKGYLFSAFILILSSIFVRATLYYCLISTVLLFFAVFSYFNPQFNKKETSLL